MTPTETTDAKANSLAERAQALRDSIASRVDGIAESGKAMISSRRTDRRREELLRELGELQYAATTGGDSPDQAMIDRVVAEIAALDVDDDIDTDTEDEAR